MSSKWICSNCNPSKILQFPAKVTKYSSVDYFWLVGLEFWQSGWKAIKSALFAVFPHIKKQKFSIATHNKLPKLTRKQFQQFLNQLIKPNNNKSRIKRKKIIITEMFFFEKITQESRISYFHSTRFPSSIKTNRNLEFSHPQNLLRNHHQYFSLT